MCLRFIHGQVWWCPELRRKFSLEIGFPGMIKFSPDVREIELWKSSSVYILKIWASKGLLESLFYLQTRPQVTKLKPNSSSYLQQLNELRLVSSFCPSGQSAVE